MKAFDAAPGIEFEFDLIPGFRIETPEQYCAVLYRCFESRLIVITRPETQMIFGPRGWVWVPPGRYTEAELDDMCGVRRARPKLPTGREILAAR